MKRKKRKTIRRIFLVCILLSPLAALGADLGTLPRDYEKEAFIRTFLRNKLGLDNPMRVVVDDSLRAAGTICAYATVQHEIEFIAINPACVHHLSPLWDEPVLYHEIAHHRLGHLTAADQKTAIQQDFEAEQWTGWAMQKTGHSLADVFAYASQGPELATSTHISRNDRRRAVQQGFQHGQSSTGDRQMLSSASTLQQKPSVNSLAALARRQLQALRQP